MSNEIILITLAVMGLLAHFLKKLMEIKTATGQIITPRQYYIANPYASLWSIILCTAGLAMLWGTAELTRVTAFMLGYMSDSAISAILKRNQP